MVCLQNLADASKAASVFATMNKGNTPPAAANFDDSYGSYMSWRRKSSGNHLAGYMGVGILAWKEYVHPKALFCPDWDSARVQTTLFGLNEGYGWHEDTKGHILPGQKYIWTSYHYRGTTSKREKYARGRYRYKRSMNTQVNDGEQIIYMDHFASSVRSILAHHMTGYNCATLGGSVHWVDDSDHWVLQSLGSNATYGQQERTFFPFFENKIRHSKAK